MEAIGNPFKEIKEDKNCYFLNTNYRLPAKTIKLISDLFYGEGKIIQHKSKRTDNNCLIFINNAMNDRRVNESYLNDGEVEIIKKVVNKFYTSSTNRIIVLCYYKATYEALENILDSKKVTLATIDSFQGREGDIVIISTTRCNEEHRIGFLIDPQRMNVAITRASQLTIIIGNSTTLNSCKLWTNVIK